MYVLSVQYSCAVVSVFLFGEKANLVFLTLFYSTLLALTHRRTEKRIYPKMFHSMFLGGGVVCLAGVGSLLRLEKKSSSRLSGWCAIVIMTGKKKVLVVCLAGAWLLLRLGFFIVQKQLDPNFLLLCISFLHCMDLQPYSNNCFSKISRTLFSFLNNTYWVSFF